MFLSSVFLFGCKVCLRTRECFGGNDYLKSARSVLCFLKNIFYSSGRLFRLLQAVARI